jgi:hypothetical protein
MLWNNHDMLFYKNNRNTWRISIYMHILNRLCIDLQNASNQYMFQGQVLHSTILKEQNSVKPSFVLCFSCVVPLVKQSSVQAAHIYRLLNRDRSDKIQLWIELLGEGNYVIMELPWDRTSKKGMTVRWVISHTPQIAMRHLNFWVNSPYWPFCLPINSPSIMQVIQYLCFI